MVQNQNLTCFNSALIIDREDTDLFICSRMFLLMNIATEIYTRKTIDSAIQLIETLPNPFDIIVIDFISLNNELLNFLGKLEMHSAENTKNTKISILSAVSDFYPKEIEQALKFKNVVMALDKPMDMGNIKKIIGFKDADKVK
ncbi:MAG: hypothetical protein M3Q58_02710 [Bacteroidota bacterium]|nr:hypothetical protein [Bacteroidota bacterium]